MKGLDESLKKYSHIARPTTPVESASETSDSVDSFVPIYRYIVEHLEQRKITYREYELYMWLRMHANMHGITSVDVRSILANLTHFKSIDYVTKIIRRLREKKYIYYADRKGYRGTFQVRFDFWLGGKGVILRFDSTNGGKYVRTSSVGDVDVSSDVRPELSDNSPRSDVGLQSESKRDISQYRPAFIRGGNNDTNKEKEIDKENTTFASKRVRVSDFVPTNGEEQRCKDLALQLNEKYIEPILKQLRSGKMWQIEKAYEIYEENVRNGKQIGNPAAYVFGVAKKIDEKHPTTKSLPRNPKYTGI